MDRAYEEYCFADPVFYDSLKASTGGGESDLCARRPVPEGWNRIELGDWLVYAPNDARLPAQGWKIHASACLDNAERILEAVWDYCVPRRILFKFVRNLQYVFIRNSKYADRGASGKFITIYPLDEAQCEQILTELGAALDGEAGPYILSDLRWGSGPLYVRYGGFVDLYTLGPTGEREPAIADGDGRLVPDRRGPTFAIPPWVTPPAFLEPHLAARAATTVDAMPYRIERAIHFSNGGGLYEGLDKRSGERVVIKEARPHAGLSYDLADAVTRLRRERDVLERLAGSEIVPALRDYFTLAEHEFLVEEFVEGSSLASLFAKRYPLLGTSVDPTVAAEYTTWAMGVCERVERAVGAFHDRGIAIGDVNPTNVIVGPDGRVVLIDFEVATDEGDPRHQALADPSFMPREDRMGADLDRYALACLRLFMFLPLTTLFWLDTDKADELAAATAELFPAAASFLAEAARAINRAPHTSDPMLAARRRQRLLQADPDSWPELRASIASAILSSATPHRDDRLFPGDVKQFPNSGLGLAYGAAGVLYSLAATGAGRFPEHEQWLLQRASTRPQPDSPIGLYDGLHGVAYAFEALGRRDDALAVLDICIDETARRWEELGDDLLGGLAGIGLNLDHFAELTGDAMLRDLADRAVERVADRLGDVDSVPTVSGGAHPYAGLIRGSSGAALLFLRHHELTGDGTLLDLAAIALRQDLRRCVVREPDGQLAVDEGWRTFPYLQDGSVGIGAVLDEYLTQRSDEEFAAAALAARRAAEGQFYIEPGLFYGRAGMILYLGRHHGQLAAREDPVIARHIEHLAWHALTHNGQLAFPGEQLMRLSMDLASGSAGVLLAVGAILHDSHVHLPFLGPLRERSAERQDELLTTTEGR